MSTDAFVDGNYNTHFIDNNLDKLLESNHLCDVECQDIAAIAAYFDYKRNLERQSSLNGKNGQSAKDNWKSVGRKMNILRI
jgi:acetyl-CoA carboxylase biotin carboxylase subunit